MKNRYISGFGVLLGAIVLAAGCGKAPAGGADSSFDEEAAGHIPPNMALFLLSNANKRSMPRAPQEMISPIPTVSMKKGIVPLKNSQRRLKNI